MTTESTPQPMTAEQVLHLIAKHLRSTHMSETRFCREAVNDPRLMGDLRSGRRPRAATIARVLAYIEATPLAAPPPTPPAIPPAVPVARPVPAPTKVPPAVPPAKLWPRSTNALPKSPATVRLLVLVESFCNATCMSASTFGALATGDPGLVAGLCNGREPRHRIQERVRAFIARELAA